jgi:hypothetical protein
MSQSARLATDQDRVIAQLLDCSGGKPIIQIVLDPENDATSISSVGVDKAEIPDFIVRLGKALTAC